MTATGGSSGVRRAAARLAPLPLVVALVVLWPTAWGGSSTWVRVTGESMLPGMRDGDLVLAREHEAYEVGDAIVYETGQGKVIHRIVGGDAETGFVTQGDNRERVDPWRPRPDDVVGRAWKQVPAGGRAIDVVTTPAVVGAAVGAYVAGRRVRRRRRRRSKEREMRTLHPRSGGRSSPVPLPTVGLAGVSVGAVVVGALLVAAMLVVPSERTTTESVPGVSHTLDVVYTAHADPSEVYPDGRIGPVAHAPEGPENLTPPPQPLYVSLVETIDATVSLLVRDGGDALDGSATLVERVVTSEGWSAERVIAAKVPLQDGAAYEQVAVDVVWARDTATRHAEVVGSTSQDFSIELVARVLPTGAAEPIASPTMAFAATGRVLEPATPQEQTVTEQREVTGMAATRLAGIPHTTVLMGGLVLLLLGLIGSGLHAIPLWHRLRRDPATRFRLLNRQRIVEVDGRDELPTPVVGVSSLPQLLRISRRCEALVLHAELDRDVHRFAVSAPDATYVVTIEGPNDGALPESSSSFVAHRLTEEIT